ncbi:terpenoid cyclases/protein prenyltransferase alpha-alpha toroid [Lentinula lateritia]|uniref:Terpenoid cyclases/protein prenyltransferase alpha-alpha toroid n=1 Tax=Lentinula aff. lateritia TaxID=2804960 RepID=A0ACC1TZB7_9AGAR|nr:terpenoid cyclases/protein prenyltransferase alpha-alpha toroid [Lentinula aff. lateritia]KAJ3855565.1 terpenoid cyclases/protein prenyltransferase alpha-alpha toroid [Lentinula lateritia]
MVQIDDNYPTPTSVSQKSTVALLVRPSPSSPSEKPTPIQSGILDTNLHLGFLGRHLLQGLPARYTSQDASQPWLLFWSLQSLSLLKVELDQGNKDKAAEGILAMQNPTEGGFGGGPSQAAHLLPTYAAICTLAIVGAPDPTSKLDSDNVKSITPWTRIDRRVLYRLFLSLKHPDGSFRVSSNGEVDVRGVYCLLAVAKLLNMMTEELVRGTKEWVRGCQTHEGGFASAAIGIGEGRWAPLGEAHGGYTFCALAAWVLLELEFPSSSSSEKKLNLRNLRRWLVQMQGGEDELYGFRGRTNKLVDGCYSWWVGGCFALLDRLEEREGDVIWNPEGLKEYILYAAQHPAGGLRDKPPKSPDMYHTLYNLAGLSAAQYASQPTFLDQSSSSSSSSVSPAPAQGAPSDSSITSSSSTPLSSSSFSSTVSDSASSTQAQPSSTPRATPTAASPPPVISLNGTDPLFNLTKTHAEAMMNWFREEGREDFR